MVTWAKNRVIQLFLFFSSIGVIFQIVANYSLYNVACLVTTQHVVVNIVSSAEELPRLSEM